MHFSEPLGSEFGLRIIGKLYTMQMTPHSIDIHLFVAHSPILTVDQGGLVNCTFQRSRSRRQALMPSS